MIQKSNDNNRNKLINIIALIISKISMPAIMLIVLIVICSVAYLEQFDVFSFSLSLILLGLVPLLSIYFWSWYIGEKSGNISSNKKRIVPYIISGACAVISSILLILVQAPFHYQFISIAITITTAVLLLCNLITKVSVHLGTTGLFCLCCSCLLYPWGLLSIPLIFLVSWSRLYLKKHTPIQVLLGSCIGIICPLITYCLLSMVYG